MTMPNALLRRLMQAIGAGAPAEQLGKIDTILRTKFSFSATS